MEEYSGRRAYPAWTLSVQAVSRMYLTCSRAFQGLLISLGNVSLPETCTQGIQQELPSHKEAGDGESLPLAPCPLCRPFHGQPV